MKQVNNTQSHAHRGPPLLVEHPCKGDRHIVAYFRIGLEKGYRITLEKDLEVATEIKVKLDSGATILFGNDTDNPASDDARFTERDLINNIFGFVLRKPATYFTFIVKGRHAPEHPPYILSIKINGEEVCFDPDRTFFGKQDTAIKEFWPEAPNKFCGRRRINREHTELIVSGTPTKIGDWPWHAALFRNNRLSIKYICGGTLISKFLVLTAAHCVTINEVPVNPETLGVVLGKTSLITNEITSQERTIFQVIVHDNFNKKTLDDDIAVLKLSAEAIFNNYVQPACLWLDAVYDQLDSYEVTGTVVGWGIDQTDSLANNLHEATMPIASKLTCILYDPIFYSNILANDKKFCAGLNNGTAACNGDSGGGFVVFVTDTRDSYYRIEYKTGAWYVRGIVSVTLARKDTSICEPNAYTVFTDVAKYKNWINNYMN
ncbi:unnamed protein product [Euphydryas editha]|uniref:Peptidase S1 domain-containing protein n=1 Tax=Euphydryas editha TaxID=104508 RepID=A0AAU9UFV3_EUPED|nr:unnamed protein product [Euphydryas editha]